MIIKKEELDSFIENWQEEKEKTKHVFLFFKNLLESLESVDLEFVPREGVTYSLRAKHTSQKKFPLFTIVDVIEGQPRWLSICFYSEMITDPEEKSNFIPEGLLGEDAFCFDLEEYREDMLQYLKIRIVEAFENSKIHG